MDIDRMSKVSLGTGNKIIRCILTEKLPLCLIGFLIDNLDHLLIFPIL